MALAFAMVLVFVMFVWNNVYQKKCYFELEHKVPALHSVLVFVSVRSLPISKVPVEEWFLFRRVRPNYVNVFRCTETWIYGCAQ